MSELLEDEQCPVCLPSSTSAYRFINNEQGSVPLLGLHYFGRSLIISTGLYAAGLRGDQLFKSALATGAAIEVSILLWAYYESKKKQDRACVPCSPGGDNARLAIDGDTKAILKEQFFYAERVAMVALGCFIASVRGKSLLRSAVLGGTAMELFILGYQFFMKRKEIQ